MPARDAPAGPGLSLRGLTSLRDGLQREFEALLQAPPLSSEAGLAALGAEAVDIVERISVLCERSGVEPSALPDPTRRAFSWFGALCDPAERWAHLDALRVANDVDARVRVRFYNTASLYRFTPRGTHIELTAQQAFVRAPRQVLTALVRVGVPYTRKRKLRAVLAAHVESPEFRVRLAELERHRRPPESAGRGACIDLGQAFERVNGDYFDGALPRPHLAWSPQVRRQEFGRFEASADTVWLNPILDDPQVPPFVAEFVLYHELLHKALGSRVQAGRRQVHNAAFRQAERRFGQRTEAESWLKRLSERLRRR